MNFLKRHLRNDSFCFSILFSLAILLSANLASARGSEPVGQPDAATQIATEQTKALLSDKDSLEKASKETAEGKTAYAQFNLALKDPEDQQEAQAISALAFEKLIQETGGDAQKLQDAISALRANPSLMEKYLDQNGRQRLKNLSARIEEKSKRLPSSR